MGAREMLIWLVFASLSACTVIWLIRPRAAPADAASVELDFYREQLAELATEADSDSDTASVRAAVGREMLSAARRLERMPRSGTQGLPRYALWGAIAVPLVALAGYLAVGSPNLPGAPLASRVAVPTDQQTLELLIAQVERRLRASRDDASGWAVIAPSYMRIGRYADAADAYAQLLRLRGESGELYAAQAEALILAGGGIVGEPARISLDAALRLTPDNVQARLWHAVRLEQDGDLKAAEAVFAALQPIAPPQLAPAIAERLAAIRQRRASAPGSAP